MSVSFDKPTDAPAIETAPALYLEITQHADGRINTITTSDRAPFPESVFLWSARTTVWTTNVPVHGAEHDAEKVLDLSLSTAYQDEDADQWATGERAASAYYAAHSSERTTLRAVEASIIRAGHLDVTTGVISRQGYGLTITTGHGGEHVIYRNADGTWAIAMVDAYEDGGWYAFGTIAPANASPRHVAAAILAHVYDGDADMSERLRPAARAYIAYLDWRRTPHWKNFKFRARQRFTRYQRRVTVRIPRR